MFSVLVLFLITHRGLSLRVHISHRINLLQQEEIRSVGPQAFVLIFSLTLSPEEHFGFLHFPCYHLFLSLLSSASSLLSLMFSRGVSEFPSSPTLVAAMQSFEHPKTTSPRIALHIINILLSSSLFGGIVCASLLIFSMVFFVSHLFGLSLVVTYV